LMVYPVELVDVLHSTHWKSSSCRFFQR